MLGHARRIPLLALETENLENNYNDVLSARSTISASSFKLSRFVVIAEAGATFRDVSKLG